MHDKQLKLGRPAVTDGAHYVHPCSASISWCVILPEDLSAVSSTVYRCSPFHLWHSLSSPYSVGSLVTPSISTVQRRKLKGVRESGPAAASCRDASAVCRSGWLLRLPPCLEGKLSTSSRRAVQTCWDAWRGVLLSSFCRCFFILIPPSCWLHATEEVFSFSNIVVSAGRTWLTVMCFQVFDFKVRPRGSNFSCHEAPQLPFVFN